MLCALHYWKGDGLRDKDEFGGTIKNYEWSVILIMMFLSIIIPMLVWLPIPNFI